MTVDQYRECVAAGGCTKPNVAEPWCSWGDSGKADHPVNCITLTQARGFCAWAEKRLPTGTEWEAAARSVGEVFLWGDAPEPPKSLPLGGSRHQNEHVRRALGLGVCWRHPGTCPTGSVVRVGGDELYDVAGNVSEWVDDDPLQDARLTRHIAPAARQHGGWGVAYGTNFTHPEVDEAVLLALRRAVPVPANRAAPEIGFRCAR